MAGRRKKIEDHTPQKRGNAPCGWCITGDHADCKRSYTYSDCSCDCGKPVVKRAPRKRAHATPLATAPAIAPERPRKPLVPRKGG